MCRGAIVSAAIIPKILLMGDLAPNSSSSGGGGIRKVTDPGAVISCGGSRSVGAKANGGGVRETGDGEEEKSGVSGSFFVGVADLEGERSKSTKDTTGRVVDDGTGLFLRLPPDPKVSILMGRIGILLSSSSSSPFSPFSEVGRIGILPARMLLILGK